MIRLSSGIKLCLIFFNIESEENTDQEQEFSELENEECKVIEPTVIQVRGKPYTYPLIRTITKTK